MWMKELLFIVTTIVSLHLSTAQTFMCVTCEQCWNSTTDIQHYNDMTIGTMNYGDCKSCRTMVVNNIIKKFCSKEPCGKLKEGEECCTGELCNAAKGYVSSTGPTQGKGFNVHQSTDPLFTCVVCNQCWNTTSDSEYYLGTLKNISTKDKCKSCRTSVSNNNIIKSCSEETCDKKAFWEECCTGELCNAAKGYASSTRPTQVNGFNVHQSSTQTFKCVECERCWNSSSDSQHYMGITFRFSINVGCKSCRTTVVNNAIKKYCSKETCDILKEGEKCCTGELCNAAKRYVSSTGPTQDVHQSSDQLFNCVFCKRCWNSSTDIQHYNDMTIGTLHFGGCKSCRTTVHNNIIKKFCSKETCGKLKEGEECCTGELCNAAKG